MKAVKELLKRGQQLRAVVDRAGARAEERRLFGDEGAPETTGTTAASEILPVDSLSSRTRRFYVEMNYDVTGYAPAWEERGTRGSDHDLLGGGSFCEQMMS